MDLGLFLVLLFVIFIFSVMQSIFGVGLLVFGTPTLLLLDFHFFECLSYLLPASISLSLIQVFKSWERVRLYKFNVLIYILPMVGVGLFLVIFVMDLNFNFTVALMLLFSSLIRFSKSIQESFELFFAKNFKFGFLITGLIHGMTNLGGATLVIITNGIYKKKEDIQTNTAYAYMFMASIQLIILIASGKFTFNVALFIFPLIASLTYLLFGNLIFESLSNRIFNKIMTFFIFTYGLILLF